MSGENRNKNSEKEMSDLEELQSTVTKLSESVTEFITEQRERNRHMDSCLVVLDPNFEFKGTSTAEDTHV